MVCVWGRGKEEIAQAGRGREDLGGEKIRYCWFRMLELSSKLGVIIHCRVVLIMITNIHIYSVGRLGI